MSEVLPIVYLASTGKPPGLSRVNTRDLPTCRSQNVASEMRAGSQNGCAD